MKATVKYFVCIYLLTRFVALGDKDSPKAVDANNCECGLFNASTIEPGTAPIMSQKLLPTGCDERGENDCLMLCANLAKISKEKGPEIVCNHLKHADKLKVSVFSRVCDKPEWKYTGVSCDHELCCHEHKHIDCVTKKEIVVPIST